MSSQVARTPFIAGNWKLHHSVTAAIDLCAQIVDAWDVIVRGDMVGPFGERLVEQVVPRRNEKEVRGYVVTAMVPYLSLVGEHHFLVVDKGSSDGVQVGNVFTVEPFIYGRTGDGTTPPIGLEEDVLVEGEGARLLTQPHMELICVP